MSRGRDQHCVRVNACRMCGCPFSRRNEFLSKMGRCHRRTCVECGNYFAVPLFVPLGTAYVWKEECDLTGGIPRPICRIDPACTFWPKGECRRPYTEKDACDNCADEVCREQCPAGVIWTRQEERCSEISMSTRTPRGIKTNG